MKLKFSFPLFCPAELPEKREFLIVKPNDKMQFQIFHCHSSKMEDKNEQ
jgi:hypothetical protein